MPQQKEIKEKIIKTLIEDLRKAIDLEEARKEAESGIEKVKKYYQLKEQLCPKKN